MEIIARKEDIHYPERYWTQGAFYDIPHGQVPSPVGGKVLDDCP